MGFSYSEGNAEELFNKVAEEYKALGFHYRNLDNNPDNYIFQSLSEIRKELDEIEAQVKKRVKKDYRKETPEVEIFCKVYSGLLDISWEFAKGVSKE